jgi:hypothetical protein
LKKLRNTINEMGVNNIDFSLISGNDGSLELNEMILNQSSWGPVLLAVAHDYLNIVKYYLEELKLNPLLFLIKPETLEEKEIGEKIRRSPISLRKDYSRYKIKLQRYNRVISILLAAKNKNEHMLEYLLES